ncbi:medium chain dehydrogenase/reductase family protein [Collimonas sp.]|jgi:alcohol dehydrogenase|uniref:medium chain dehydrogenase/reductase family protein n=1 Tax=Collimonas sp. TaxID=1963772 RepID=UPI002C3A5412|nr:medium chain dehydrogenase/reductase family protein [Collimonas sp.]HWW06396.1 medium chain dehydrogenase/reductase family protein [Collimonas sp.]
MKAWMFNRSELTLALQEVAQPELRAGAALVRMEAVPLLSYTGNYLKGDLPYAYPPSPFTPGTNGIGRIVAVGAGVQQFKPGQRVALNPYWIANEAVAEPPQVLIGLTAVSHDSAQMLEEFRHGSLREVADVPASTPLPLDGLDHLSAERLALLAKFVVPFGGLRRGRLAAGETVAINGASGYFGSAAVLAALALGAAKVIALGRRAQALQQLVALGKGRVVPLVLTGDIGADAAAIREAAGGAIELAFDMVGQASDANSTLALLHSLRRGGRLVLMGSMQAPLPIPYGEMLLNNWELIGHFMYTPADYLALLSLLRAGLLSLDEVDLKTFAFSDLPAAIDHAAQMQGLQATVALMAQ